jgi:hypothetical protein
LAWNDDGLSRSRDELLAAVRARGERIRTRRQALAGMAAVVALLAVAVPASLSLRAAGRAGDTLAVAGPPPTSPVAPAVLADPTTTAAPTTEPPPAPTTTTTTVAPTTTTAAPLATAPPPSVPRRTTTTTAPEALLACDPTMFTGSVTTDKAQYRPGETVSYSGTFRNTSGRTCHYVSDNRSAFVESAATGRPVQLVPIVHGDHFRPVPVAPGEEMTQTGSWDQRVCADDYVTCGPAPAGTYRAVVQIDRFGVARASFEVL